MVKVRFLRSFRYRCVRDLNLFACRELLFNYFLRARIFFSQLDNTHRKQRRRREGYDDDDDMHVAKIQNVRKAIFGIIFSVPLTTVAVSVTQRQRNLF